VGISSVGGRGSAQEANGGNGDTACSGWCHFGGWFSWLWKSMKKPRQSAMGALRIQEKVSFS
jgi:hypothetical protein